MKLELPFRRRRAWQGWLAVSLGDGAARFAHVEPGAKPRLRFLEERQWNAGEPAARERTIKAIGAQAYRCTTLLSQRDYQIVQVEAPNVPREELKAAIRWRIKDMIDYHVDDATLDVLSVPHEAGSARPPSMYAVVARKETVQRLIARFDEARIPLGVIDVPDTAQRNIAALYEPSERAVVALSFDADGGLITVSAGGELYLSRRLDITYAQANASAAVYDRVLVEVQRSLDHFERNFAAMAVAKVLVAPMAQADALVAHLAANVYLPVEAMDLAAVIDLPEEYAAALPDVRAGWFRLIGAGLRVEEAAT